MSCSVAVICTEACTNVYKNIRNPMTPDTDTEKIKKINYIKIGYANLRTLTVLLKRRSKQSVHKL